MQSFSYEVKNELIRVVEVKECCLQSELTALLKIGSVIYGNRIEFTNSNAAVARRVLKLVKLIYSGINTEVAVIRTKKLRKINRYVVRIFLSQQTEKLLEDLKSKGFPVSNCCRRAYLRGAFLAGGSINRPESQYRVEIAAPTRDKAMLAKKVMRKLNLIASIYERKEKFVVYLKEFESILDFLYLIKAETAVEKFEVARNIKEVRMQVNRLVNCETANLQKMIDSNQRQLEDINIIRSHKIKLNAALESTIDARIKNPDMSISELAPLLFLSKSGLKYRMRRLHEIALKVVNHNKQN